MSITDGWNRIPRFPVSPGVKMLMYSAATKEYGIFDNIPDNPKWTHWRAAAAFLPEPPNEETQAQKDDAKFDEYCRERESWPCAIYSRTAWHAALAYRDAQNAEDLRLVSPGLYEGHISARNALFNLLRRCGLDK